MQELLRGIWAGDQDSARKTVLCVTHDIDKAVFMGRRAKFTAALRLPAG